MYIYVYIYTYIYVYLHIYIYIYIYIGGLCFRIEGVTVRGLGSVFRV